MAFNIPMGVGSALSGAAGAYNNYAVEERQFEKQKTLEQMAFDNYLKKQSMASEMQFEQEKKIFNWKNEQEKLHRKAQAEELRHTWDQDNDIVDEETKEYRKWSLDLWPIYGERTPEVVNSYLNGKDRKLKKDLDAQSEYIDRVNTALQGASPEQLRDTIWQSEVKRNARMGLKVRDISLFDKVDDSYFPKIERESPTNIPNDLEAFTLQHPLAKGRPYSSLPADIRQSIYAEWDEKKVSTANARMGDAFVIAARELYPGIDPQHIQGEAMTKVRSHMANIEAEKAGKKEEVVQSEKPLQANDKEYLGMMGDTIRVMDTLRTKFTPEERKKFAGALEFRGNKLANFIKDNPRFSEFKTMIAQAEATAFDRGGKQLTEMEANIVFGYVPTAREWSASEFESKLNRAYERAVFLRNQRESLIGKSRKDYKGNKPKSDPLGLFK